jgi:hypothetical protein
MPMVDSETEVAEANDGEETVEEEVNEVVEEVDEDDETVVETQGGGSTCVSQLDHLHVTANTVENSEGSPKALDEDEDEEEAPHHSADTISNLVGNGGERDPKTDPTVGSPMVHSFGAPSAELGGGRRVENVRSEVVKTAHVVSPTRTTSFVDRPIGWEKPQWTVKSPLRSKSCGYGDPSSPLRRLEWDKPHWVAEPIKLRSTGKADVIKTVGNLAKPITHVEKNHLDDINFEANPLVLKPTETGFKVRNGSNLAKPITHIDRDPMGDINFEANPAFVLKNTELGEEVKKGASLAAPVTNIREVIKNEAASVNFVANPSLLRRTEKGKVVKEKGDLQAPITHVVKEHLDDINFEANPLILKSTAKGTSVRMGESLAR